MFEVFSTRKIATGVWICIIFFFLVASKKFRKHLFSLTKKASSPKLVMPFVFLSLYLVLILLLSSKLPFWEHKFIKDYLLWFFLVGVPICFNALINKPQLQKIFLNVISFTVILEFIISTFTFPLYVELLLLPLLSLITLLYVFSSRSPDNQSVEKLLGRLLVIIGFIILGSALFQAYNTYEVFSWSDSLVSFSIPIILSLLFIPATLCFALFSAYEMAFIKINFLFEHDKKLNKQFKLIIVRECKFSYDKIRYLEKKIIPRMHRSMELPEFKALVKQL